MINMVLVAIAPSVALLIFIYQRDRYDREPPSLLFKLFLYGSISTLPVYFVEKFLMGYCNHNALLEAFIVAGLTEESIKFIIVMKTAFRSKYYDEKLDGIVYCVFASLGFATAENLLYIFSRSDNFLYTGITRAILSVPAHMLFAITMGYYLSLSKFTKNRVKALVFLIEALIVPILLHGIYDYILMSKVYGFFLLLLAFVIYLWRINLKRLNIYVRDSRIGKEKQHL